MRLPTILAILFLLSAQSTTVTAGQRCGHLGVKNRYKKRIAYHLIPPLPKTHVCRVSYSQWMCLDGAKISYQARPVVRVHCNDTAYGDGWRAKGIEKRNYDVGYLNTPARHRGYKVQATGVFTRGGCVVKLSGEVAKGPARFVVSYDFDICAAHLELPLRIAIYGNEDGDVHQSHPGYGEDKDGIGSFETKEFRSAGPPLPEPGPICGDGVQNQAGEQCDGDGSCVDPYQYCTSACTCADVAPFPDGAFILTPNGTVYRSAGKSPVQLFTCSRQGAYPGCPASFWNAPQDFVDALRELYPVPVDGTLVRKPDYSVFRMECGQPRYVQSCAQVGGCEGLIDLDGLAVDSLNRGPQCDDGNLCTTDACLDVSQCIHTPVSCDDGNSCTEDACDPSSGACNHFFVPSCLAPVVSLLLDGGCGDGVVDAGEDCDDGATP